MKEARVITLTVIIIFLYILCADHGNTALSLGITEHLIGRGGFAILPLIAAILLLWLMAHLFIHNAFKDDTQVEWAFTIFQFFAWYIGLGSLFLFLMPLFPVGWAWAITTIVALLVALAARSVTIGLSAFREKYRYDNSYDNIGDSHYA